MIQMPPKDKVEVTIKIEVDQLDWLLEMVSTFDLEDDSKAVRVLLDYAIEDGDEEHIFSIENTRCRRC